MKTVISVNQLLPLANKPQANFQTMKSAIAKNSAAGSQLAIFPEDFLYGVLRGEYELIEAGKQFDAWIRKFCELAQEYDIDIIPGTLPCFRNGRIYNSTVYIDRRGKVLTHYSKNNLWLSEREHYQPSLQLPEVFTSVLGKTAIIICWDIFDHKLFKSAVTQGAEWVIVLAFWSINQSADLAAQRGVVHNRYPGFSDSKVLDSLIPARVSEYNLGMVFCNFAGKHSYMGKTGPQVAISANRSQVVIPYLSIQYKLSNRKEATLTCQVDDITQRIDDFEVHYGRRSDIVNARP